MDATCHDPTRLRLAVELHGNHNGMAGSITDERGTEHAFTGWLGLLTLLEAARARMRSDAGA